MDLGNLENVGTWAWGRGVMLPLGQTMMMMTGAGLGSGRGRNWPNLNKLNLGSSSDMPPPPSLSSPPHPALLIPVEYAEYGVYSHIKPNALFIHSPLSLFSSPYFFSGTPTPTPTPTTATQNLTTPRGFICVTTSLAVQRNYVHPPPSVRRCSSTRR